MKVYNAHKKVKLNLNVLENINSYDCCKLTTTQNMKNIKSLGVHDSP